MGQTIKVSTVAPVVVSDFHRAAFGIVRTAAKATGTMAQKLSALLVTKYGEPVIGKDDKGAETRSGGPSFDQYRADQSALAQLAKDAKLADNQFYRKSYAAAVRTLYGAIPVSQDAAAVAKRAQRDAAKVVAKAQQGQEAAPQAGAPKGETTDRQPSPEEVAEQLVTRIGLWNTVDACLRILKADKSTQAQAIHLERMVAKAKEAAAKAAAPKEPATV